MKTQLIIIVMLLLGAYQQVKAQTGIRAGWNYSKIHDISNGGNSGFHAGIYKKISLLGLIGVEPSIQYSQKGAEVDNMGTSGKERLHYIDVPVLVRLGFIPLINVFAGPQASFLVARKYDGATNVSSINELSQFDMGGVVGVGVNLPLGFNVQGSYDFGFSDLNYNDFESKNRLIKVSIGKNF
ncbi:PorT family protein [Echinicola marina]|uniref:outer membrane beta-barrel protein n=1 Tax=Echinicola marina TaxID=2859768 RepID=UPI001CF6780D|nr:outer membrane beta-barrel protein [Echinicola marina]UCS93110.1 PorT family protein [Echinicola marina]